MITTRATHNIMVKQYCEKKDISRIRWVQVLPTSSYTQY